MTATTYRIADEPVPSARARAVVNPFWPLLSVMFAGAWLAWPWYVWNGYAIGSPTRRREAAIAALGFVGALALGVALLVLAEREVIGERAIPYAVLSLSAWKLGVTYWLHVVQMRTFHLYEHFAGRVRNGAVVVAVGALLGRPLVIGLVDHVLWRIVVGS